MDSLRFQLRTISRTSLGTFVALSLACGLPDFLLAQPAGTAIVFYSQPEVNEGLWPVLFETLQEDLASNSAELPEGVSLDNAPALLRSRELRLGIDFIDVIEVRLLGRCDVLPQLSRQMAPGPLGWVTRVSGRIQPFVSIDCGRIAQLIGPATVCLNKEQRRRAMTKAIARIMIHEWIHIASQSSAHSRYGIEQASLSARELLADAHSDHAARSDQKGIGRESRAGGDE